MAKVAVKAITIALGFLGLLSVGLSVLAGGVDELGATARVLNAEGREIGVMVNGRYRPHPSAVQSVDLIPCSPAVDRGPMWAFCRDGFYFSNVFEYRQYMVAKRALSRYTGPVIVEVAGRESQSFLENGWLR